MNLDIEIVQHSDQALRKVPHPFLGTANERLVFIAGCGQVELRLPFHKMWWAVPRPLQTLTPCKEGILVFR